MADLRTSYMGMTLDNPIIVASSPLTSSIENLIKCEDSGAGAVVLKSIFEEQINAETLKATTRDSEYLRQADYESVYGNIARDYFVDQYVKLIAKAKERLSIPVIASINCSHVDSWAEYAKRFKNAGSDALELNYYPIASDACITGDKIDRSALEFAHQARKVVDLPIALKIGSHYSSLANLIRGFAKEGMDALVLFNNFFHPDIDIENETLCGMQSLSHENAYHESLRWIALMAAETKDVDFAASTGIHSGETVIKMLLSGAKVTEICSAVLKDGFEVISKMKETLNSWMDKKGYKVISDFQGKLAQENISDGAYWERTQYMKNLTSL